MSYKMVKHDQTHVLRIIWIMAVIHFCEQQQWLYSHRAFKQTSSAGMQSTDVQKYRSRRTVCAYVWVDKQELTNKVEKQYPNTYSDTETSDTA